MWYMLAIGLSQNYDLLIKNIFAASFCRPENFKPYRYFASVQNSGKCSIWIEHRIGRVLQRNHLVFRSRVCRSEIETIANLILICGLPLRFVSPRSAPPRSTPLRSTRRHSAPLRSAPLRPARRHSTPLHFAPFYSAPFRSAPLRSASPRSAPLRSAPPRSTPLRSASPRSAPLRSALLRPTSCILLRSAPLRFAQPHPSRSQG
jgi:hypothetical protein